VRLEAKTGQRVGDGTDLLQALLLTLLDDVAIERTVPPRNLVPAEAAAHGAPSELPDVLHVRTLRACYEPWDTHGGAHNLLALVLFLIDDVALEDLALPDDRMATDAMTGGPAA
jgi:hypothetical protein